MVKILFFFFQFFQFFNFFWKMASMGPIECWKEQSHKIWAHLRHPLLSYNGLFTCAGTKCQPPCSIGLRLNPHLLWHIQIFDWYALCQGDIIVPSYTIFTSLVIWGFKSSFQFDDCTKVLQNYFVSYVSFYHRHNVKWKVMKLDSAEDLLLFWS